MKGLLSFTLIILLALLACKKKASDPEPAPASTTTTTTTGTNPTIDINSEPQVSYSFDGTQKYYAVDHINYADAFGAGGGGTPYTHLKYYISCLSPIPNGNNIIEITKNVIVPTASTTVSDSAFNTFFPLTSIPYSVDTANGVSIEIRDNNNVLWATDYGTGDQTGSTFNIVQTRDEKQNHPFQPNTPYIKTYITFSCKVYNTNGAMKTITNGKYVGHFSNF